MKAFFRAVMLVGVASSTAFATNGFEMIGVSAASTGMGGTGVANYTNGTDAIYKNPALLGAGSSCATGKVTLEVNGSFIMPNATADGGTGATTSKGGGRFLPDLVGTYKMNDKFTFGLGVITIGGDSVDYTGNAAVVGLKTEMAAMRVAATASYQANSDLSFGVTPFISYGGLSINEATSGTESTRAMHSATGVGVQIGATAKPVPAVTLGATFTSKQSLTYSQIINLDIFGPNFLTAAASGLSDIPVEHPLELAAGVAYTGLENWKFSFDYRFINWADAQTFHELGWANQNVFALGAEYAVGGWALRAGFNYAASPLSSNTSENGSQQITIAGHPVYQRHVSLIDVAALPAFETTHITVGGGFKISDSLTADAAFVYSPSVTLTRGGSGAFLPGESNPYSFTATMQQWSLAAGLSYVF